MVVCFVGFDGVVLTGVVVLDLALRVAFGVGLELMEFDIYTAG